MSNLVYFRVFPNFREPRNSGTYCIAKKELCCVASLLLMYLVAIETIAEENFL